MARLTRKIDNIYLVNMDYIKENDNEYCGDAITKLAKFENLIDEIKLKHDEISKYLELLRDTNQTKSYKFREALGHKLINSAIITIFEEHGLM